MSLLSYLDYAGIALFAATGALAASRKQLDMIGFLFFAVVTGLGGGTVRDLLIGAPVFWVRDPWVAPVCLGVALIAWFTPRRWWEGQLLEYADAAGLAAQEAILTGESVPVEKTSGRVARAAPLGDRCVGVWPCCWPPN